MVIGGQDPYWSNRRHNKKWIELLCLVITLCTTLIVSVRADTEVSAVVDLLNAGEYLAALTLLEDLKPIRPCDPDLLFLEARVYETAGETDRAITYYEILIDLFPDAPEPYNNLAVLYATQGKLRKAEALLLRGLDTHTTYRQIQKNLSRIYVARAAQAYRNALNIGATTKPAEVKSSALQLLDSETLIPLSEKVFPPTASECQKRGNTL